MGEGKEMSGERMKGGGDAEMAVRHASVAWEVDIANASTDARPAVVLDCRLRLDWQKYQPRVRRDSSILYSLHNLLKPMVI